MTPKRVLRRRAGDPTRRKATSVAQSALLPLPAPTGRGQAAGHQARHVLALPGDVEIDEVETLALSRFAGTRWELAPDGVEPPLPVPRAAPGAPGVLRTSRHTTLTGPYAPPQSYSSEIAMVFDVVCPRERGEPPYHGGGDRDGTGRAFPRGLPRREEERVVAWAVAACRRLGGALRLDVGDPAADSGAGVLLTPDPAAAVDLCLYSDVWLDPNAAQALVARVHPRTTLATEGVSWQGPPQGISELPLYHGEKLAGERRREIHAAADDFDIEALTTASVLDGYGLLIDLGMDGIVAVEVGGEEQLPLLLRGLPWTARGAVAYRVRWEPPDLVDSQRESPSMEHRVARGRAAELVAQVVRALYGATGGEVADEADFLLDPDDL